ncbi:TetR/AcrR family transcriptional regulator [Pseudomonas sp. SDO528_S397]
MDPTPQDERLIRALARAIVDRPRATLKDLAEAAGVSKATLHRFCSTRDNLVQVLEARGEAALNQVVHGIDLSNPDPLATLRSLISEHLEHREMLAFLLFQYRSDTVGTGGESDRWLSYINALDEFFLHGQRLGAFRIDITAAVYSELFLTMIFAMVDAERRGRAASAHSIDVLEKMFLHGAVGAKPSP